MSTPLKSGASRATLLLVLERAAKQALQYRLMLLWVVGMAIPTILFTLPVLSFLGSELNHSPDSASIASSLGIGPLVDLLNAHDLSVSLLFAAFAPSMLVMLVISPWLNALALGAARMQVPANFRALVGAANAGYWSMVRMGLLGLVPLLVALMLVQFASGAVQRYDAHAVLESPGQHLFNILSVFAVLGITLAQCTVEVGRAVLVAQPRRRSVVRAWLAGLGFLRRHPLILFGTWLLVTLPVQLLVAVLMVLRTNLDQGGAIGLVAALLLAEACVAFLAWMRCARLFSLVDLVARFTAIR